MPPLRATTAAQAARDTVAAVNEETRKATLAAHAAVTGVGRGRERDGKSPGTRLRKGHFVCVTWEVPSLLCMRLLGVGPSLGN